MPIPSRTVLLASLLLPLISAGIPVGAACAGACPGDRGASADCGSSAAAPVQLAWRDYGYDGPPPDRYDGRRDGRYDGRYDDRYDDRGRHQSGRRDGYYQRQYPREPQRQGPLPPQAYPGGVRPKCAPGTHLEGYDCVKNASGPAIIDQPRGGCPRDYHTNRKGTKCVRDGYEE